MAMLVFYGFRIIVQQIFFVEYPQGYLWGWPGFFSLFVPYGSTPDFFYSGHVGVCMLHVLEFYAIGWYWMSAYALLAMFLQIFLMVALRSHYTMDMFAGIVFAHYFWIMSEKYSFVIDWYIFRIPLAKRLANDSSYTEYLENNENKNEKLLTPA